MACQLLWHASPFRGSSFHRSVSGTAVEGISVMSRTRKAVAAAGFAALLAAPSSARADEGARIAALEDRLRTLEDRLDESQRVIASQATLLEKQAPATPAVSSGASEADPGGFLKSL